MTIGHNLSGALTVTGNVVNLTVAPRSQIRSAAPSWSRTRSQPRRTGDVSGSVTESGIVALLTIGGSLTASGKITASNTNDPSQLPLTAVPTYANITTMSVGQNLVGKLTVTGNVTTLTVGGTVSGTVFVQGTLTTMKVTGDVSGTVTESGTINLLTIGGSLTATGIITAANTNDPNQLPPLDPPWLGNIVTFTITGNLAGHVLVTGDLTTLTVGGNLSVSCWCRIR